MIEIRVINWPTGPCAAGPSYSLDFDGDDDGKLLEHHDRQFDKAHADAALIRELLALAGREPPCSTEHINACKWYNDDEQAWCAGCQMAAIKSRHAAAVGGEADG